MRRSSSTISAVAIILPNIWHTLTFLCHSMRTYAEHMRKLQITCTQRLYVAYMLQLSVVHSSMYIVFFDHRRRPTSAYIPYLNTACIVFHYRLRRKGPCIYGSRRKSHPASSHLNALCLLSKMWLTMSVTACFAIDLEKSN